MKRLLVALDGSAHGERALDLAADLALALEAELLVVHVLSAAPLGDGERHMAAVEYADELERWSEVQGSPPTAAAPELLLRYGDLARHFRELTGKRLIAKAEARLKKKGITAAKSILEVGEPAATILRLAEDHGVDAIVMGSRGLGEIKGLLLGSVSHKVSQLAACTCITVK